MRFPWQRKPEVRESASFTDALVSLLQAGATGEAARATATAAVEAAAGTVGRGFAAARVEDAPDAIAPALGPETLALTGRNLIRTGEAVFAIEARGGRVQLIPAGTHDIRGAADPAGWMYRLDLFGPSGSETRLLPAASVLHIRYAVDPSRPWLGVSPLGWAALSGKLHAGAVAALEADMRAAPAYAVPMPGGQDGGEEDDALDGLRAAILQARGKSVFVETVKGAFGGDTRDAPARDWKQERLGSDPPATLASLHDSTAAAVLAACGVPPEITGLVRSDGTGRREAYRAFERATLQPLARIVEAEIAAKLEATVRLDFTSLRASDTASIARAYKALVEAGLSADQAAAIVDLELEG